MAAGLGCLPATGVLPKVSLAAAALLGAAMWVRGRERSTERGGSAQGADFTLADDVLAHGHTGRLLIVLGIAQQLAGPSLGGTCEHVSELVTGGADRHLSRVGTGGG